MIQNYKNNTSKLYNITHIMKISSKTITENYYFSKNKYLSLLSTIHQWPSNGGPQAASSLRTFS